ncbi:thiamine phosphate synthase [Arcanobacterium haemolyticum]|nr:thiamine phosphate synthase [Arcanobacterium haemolyticum]
MNSEQLPDRVADALPTSSPLPTRADVGEGIYLVTDPGMSMARIGEPYAPEGSASHAWHHKAIEETVRLVREASAAGVPTIQLRWKDVDAGYFLDLTLAAADAIQPGTSLVVNDRVDVYLAARACGATVAGVHIGQTDLPPRAVRDIVGEDAYIGWSASTDAELRAANDLAEVIDAVGVGVLRHTDTKPDAPPALGINGMQRACNLCELPVVAIGGIKPHDLADLAHTSVTSAAIVSAIVAAENPAEAAATCVRLWDEVRGETR